MTSIVREWLEKAESDFNSAHTLYRSRKHPDFDGACFFAQQSVEKLMKAALIRRKRVPPKTHDLIVLHDLLARAVRQWQCEEKSLRILSRGAVAFRYPGAKATRAEAREALRLCREIRDLLLPLV